MIPDEFNPAEEIGFTEEDREYWDDRLLSLVIEAQDIAIEVDAACEFASSVEGKADSMRDFLAEHGYLTKKQQGAIENMEEGVQRWCR